ncbi:hypothetical protein HYPSUDRAFT_147737 [Hypholoma sublateritium FD-334 SS-4]|uniref:Uncharacterized protein n=1 Tax=Hypholoma sublateritium (strain FD-334 SS-4) TaxID=945553 RepID=A0A0D2P7R6_HYPSF|nr:hypothetical protein HYPSUDRAFT_147737 [Hypholoma sublateritium FD-334 SS-4]
MDDDTLRNAVETLEVEDEEHRQARIQAYLEKLNASSQTRTFSQPQGMPKFDFGDRTTFPIKPPTELLSRVQAFLPQLEASNALLSQRAQEDPDSINIEHIPKGMEQYIEMNLGLGLFEDRSAPKADAAGTSEMSTSSSSSDSDDNEQAQNDSSDDDSDKSSEIITSFVPSRPVKPLPKRACNKGPPEIVVLHETSES